MNLTFLLNLVLPLIRGIVKKAAQKLKESAPLFDFERFALDRI